MSSTKQAVNFDDEEVSEIVYSRVSSVKRIWIDDKGVRHFEGTIIYSNGDRYEGEWVERDSDADVEDEDQVEEGDIDNGE